ncbi:mitochondrial ribosomal subunit s27 domain-containing protein [Purpureocillium lilacinum]|uniref:Small ribosomal subunit protein mS33 n=1 Tax=Purpureocillium lilacinum TaxID=33203 RepID=A0A179GQU7_PURLI|nr:mitochondrial ribosomal subunit s27 domain-containing protein [Purpureocillium lilacinum]
MSVPRAQCQVFATTFNPEGARMGNKVLRQRLKGPAVAAYYPRKTATIKDVKREFGPILATWDDAEEDRFEYIEEYAEAEREECAQEEDGTLPRPARSDDLETPMVDNLSDRARQVTIPAMHRSELYDGLPGFSAGNVIDEDAAKHERVLAGE